MLKKVISSINHFIEYDIWKQKGKFLILFLLTGLYFGVINYHIADNEGIITSIEGLKYLGGIYVNIPFESLDGVKWFLGIFGVSILLWIIYWLYGKVKNFLTLTKFLIIFLLSLFGYFSFGNDLIINFLFVSFLPVLVGFAIIFGIYVLHFLLLIKAFISSRYSGNNSGNDTDKPLEFGKGETIENIKKMQDLGYDSIAKNLAKRLKEEFKKDSSAEVIGIEGGWGSGKSSFINLVKYYVYTKEKISFPLPKFIRESDVNKKWDFHFSWERNQLYDFFNKNLWSTTPPTFLEFNPWYFESTTNLMDSFFRSVSEHIEQEYHIATGSTFEDFSKSVSIQGEYEFFGIKFSFGNTPTSLGHKEKLDSINTILDSINSPIIVIIDDLDRINLEQCKQIFQLIYLCGNLRNIHFLVSYDSEKFNSIDVPTFVTYSKEQKGSNYNEYRSVPIIDYIKKIIHEPIIIIPSTLGLKGLIKDYLKKSIEGTGENADDLELNNVLDNIFDPRVFPKYQKYLRNPRAIKRFFLFSFGKKGQINKNAGLQKYTMSAQRRNLLIKIGILYFEKKELFLDIANEIQLIDEKLRTNKEYLPGDDVKFYPVDIITLNSDDYYEKRKKNLEKYCENLTYSEDVDIIKDIFIDKALSGNDLKYIVLDYFLNKESIAIIKGKGFFGAIQGTNKELSYLGNFSKESAEFFSKTVVPVELSVFLRNVQESVFYKNKPSKFKDAIDKQFLDENHRFIIDKVFGNLRDYIRDDGNVSEEWIMDFYRQLFTELKSADFPVPAEGEKFSDTLLGHISDNIGLSIYSLIFWIEKQRGYFDMTHEDAQRILREIFDNHKLFENWGIFGASYLLRLWSALNELKYSNLISEDTKTWTAQFVFDVFSKNYIQPRKSFFTGNSIIDRYWINFVKYQFMSQKEMGAIVISGGDTSKIGDKIGEYFQDIIYTDPRFSDILLLFKYLVAMGYTYSDEFRTRYLHYSGESDWNDNPYMKKILLHFKSQIETYIQNHPDEKMKINSRYDGYDPIEFSISEIWEDLKKVTKLDNPPAE